MSRKILNKEINVLEREYEKACEEDSERFQNAPEGMGYEEFIKYMSVTSNKVSELSQKLRLVKEPTFSELSNFGDVMSLQEFIDCVNSGGFIDYDGYGNYVRDGQESDIEIYPSDVKNGSVRKDFDTIIWFNR